MLDVLFYFKSNQLYFIYRFLSKFSDIYTTFEDYTFFLAVNILNYVGR